MLQQSEELLNGIFFFGMSNSLVNPVIYGAFHLWPKKKTNSDRYVSISQFVFLHAPYEKLLDTQGVTRSQVGQLCDWTLNRMLRPSHILDTDYVCGPYVYVYTICERLAFGTTFCRECLMKLMKRISETEFRMWPFSAW